MKQLIKKLRQTDKYIETIYTKGGCYKFYKFIKFVFPEAEAYITESKDHIIIKYKGLFYDITGVVKRRKAKIMTDSDIKECEEWSFGQQQALAIKECPYCKQDILI